MVRGTYRYESHQEPWTELRMRIREIAQSRVRYGYRKIRVLLNREGWRVGKVSGVPAVQGRRPGLEETATTRRKAVRHREERFMATAPNQAWSMDFVADQLQDGNAFPGADDRGCLHARKRSHRSRPEPEGRRCGASPESD